MLFLLKVIAIRRPVWKVCILTTTLVIFPPFPSLLKKEGRRKAEWIIKNCDQNSCLLDRSNKYRKKYCYYLTKRGSIANEKKDTYSPKKLFRYPPIFSWFLSALFIHSNCSFDNNESNSYCSSNNFDINGCCFSLL